MKIHKITLMAFVLIALAACAVPGGFVTEPPVPTDTFDPTPTPTGSAGPVQPPGPEPVEEIYSVAWLESLPPDTILLQLDYEPTFFREEAFHAFGRIPPFTLFADGTVVYLDESGDQQLYIAHVALEDVSTLLHEIRDAGFPRLEDHTDFCGPGEDGEEICVADAAFTILRMILPDGTMKEVRSYANFSNDPAALQEIVRIMTDYTHPDAEFYMPEMAVLFLRELPGDTRPPVREWPLPVERIPPLSETLTAIVLEPAEAETFITAVGQNNGEWFFQVGETIFSAYLVPWLPFHDYTEQVLEAFPPVDPEPVDETLLQIQAAAIANLATALGIPEDEIVVTDHAKVTWPNGCLGITTLEIPCTEGLVEGYQLFLEAKGQTYEYRSNLDGSLVLPAGDNPLPPVDNE